MKYFLNFVITKLFADGAFALNDCRHKMLKKPKVIRGVDGSRKRETDGRFSR